MNCFSNQEILIHINDLHVDGYENAAYEDEEWVNSFKYFILEEIKLNSLKISALHGGIYSDKTTDFPPIVIDNDSRFILDGNHRAKSAQLLGHTKILAYVGYTCF